MKLFPMNPLAAAAISLASGGGMWIILRVLFAGDPMGSVIAGSVVGMLTFGILIAEDTKNSEM